MDTFRPDNLYNYLFIYSLVVKFTYVHGSDSSHSERTCCFHLQGCLSIFPIGTDRSPFPYPSLWFHDHDLPINQGISWTYTLQPWRWRYHVPPKSRYRSTRPHDATNQKTRIVKLYWESRFLNAINNSLLIHRILCRCCILVNVISYYVIVISMKTVKNIKLVF